MSVLIITDKRESSIIDVYDWINYYGKTCHLVNYKEFVETFSIDRKLTNQENTYVVYHKRTKEPISSIWFRREHTAHNTFSTDWKDEYVKTTIENLIQKEILSLKRIFWNNRTEQMRILSNFDSTLLDKFDVLKIAQNIGLKIPETIVTNQKEVLSDFVKKHGTVISKAAYENLSFRYYRTAFMQYVDVLSEKDLDKIPDNFFPSVFQQQVKPEMSIRAFFLDGNIYATAIINTDELVDYRADFENRRTIPIQLPQDVETNLKTLMKRLEINIGGIDLLKQNEDFYFLEVNPNGYFGRNSQICNYNISKKIAQFLTV